MKKKRVKTSEKVAELINFAEELVGKVCIVKEDSVLAVNRDRKSAIMEDFIEKTPDQYRDYLAMKLATNFRREING